MEKVNLCLDAPTAILGFGNPVRSDDAVGIYVIEKLLEKLNPQENLKILDMGTSAFEVLFELKGQTRIILVDGVINTGEPVGTLFKVPAAVVEQAPQNDPLVFLHGLKWDQALSYAKKILGDAYPKDIQVYLIAIENTRLGMGLGPEAQAAGDKVVQLILEELKTMEMPSSAASEVASTNLPSSIKGEIQLKTQHLLIDPALAEAVLPEESHVLLRYYPERQALLMAGMSQAWFKKMHEATPYMLKNKNQQGQKSVALHEILIDFEIDGQDRTLAYEVQGNGKILNIRLL
ncbi:MAG: hypothetical protein OHK0053_10460 [Microscillaceae bacterium]